MDKPLSRRVSESIEAVSIRYNNMVYELQQKGVAVIVLSLGEAFFEIPLKPFHDLPFPALYHYSHSRGILPLREQIARYYQKHFAVSVDPAAQLIVTAGSKAAIFFTIMATLNPGDQALMQEPTWVSYPEQIKLVGGEPILIPYTAGVRDYERYITPKTRLIIINNPHNPRGDIMRRPDLQYLLDLARANGLYILADEAYSDFVRGSAFESLGALDRNFDNTVVVNSISKNFGISGWRLGYAFSNEALIRQILKINQHVVTCPATVLQQYVAKHWDFLEATCEPQIVALGERRVHVTAMMDRLGLARLPGSSTFYFFVSIAPSKLSSEEFSTLLLREHHVAVVPGIGYGASCDAFVRVSMGTESPDRIEAGLHRIKTLVDQTS